MLHWHIMRAELAMLTDNCSEKGRKEKNQGYCLKFWFEQLGTTYENGKDQGP